jgi:hypothetical protein
MALPVPSPAREGRARHEPGHVANDPEEPVPAVESADARPTAKLEVCRRERAAVPDCTVCSGPGTPCCVSGVPEGSCLGSQDLWDQTGGRWSLVRLRAARESVRAEGVEAGQSALIGAYGGGAIALGRAGRSAS